MVDPKFELKQAPDLHPGVDLNDLNLDGKLKQHKIVQSLQMGNKTFALYKILGKGGYGQVWLAQDVHTKQWIAVKSISVDNQKEINRVNKEINELNNRKELIADEQIGNSVYVAMTLANGPTLDKVMGKLDEDVLWNIITDFLTQVRDLKNLHRDIKLNNATLENKNKVRLLDFGLVKTGNNQNKTKNGAPAFSAPEIYQNGKYVYTKKTDHYAALKTVAFMLGFIDIAGKLIDDEDVDEEKREIFEHIKNSLSENPIERPSIQESIEFFEAQKKSPKQLKNIAVVSFRELKNNPAKFIHAFRAFQEVYILNDYQETDIQLHQVIGQLKHSGIFISGIIEPSAITDSGRLAIAQFLKQEKNTGDHIVFVSNQTRYIPDCPLVKINDKKQIEDYQNEVDDLRPKFTLEFPPTLHPLVDKTRILTNGKFLTEETIEEIKSKNLLDGHYPELSLTKVGSKYFVHYEKLGAGANGEAILAQDIDTNEWVVIKTVKTHHRKRFKVRAQKEIEALRERGELKASLETQDQTYMVMELANSVSLDKLIGKLPEHLLWNIIIEFLEEVRSLQSLHRDIKPDNIKLHLTDKIGVKLVDFGWTKKDNNKINKFDAATPAYKDPSINIGGRYLFSKTSDLYAAHKSIAQILGLLNKNYNLVDNARDIKLRPALTHLKRTLSANPSKRPSIEESIEFFEQCRQNRLKTLDKFRNIAVVSLEDVNVNSTLFAEALRHFEQIYIVNDNDAIQLHRVIGKLQEEGIFVTGILKPYELLNDNDQLHIARFLENKKSVNNYVYVSHTSEYKTDCEKLQISPNKNSKDYEKDLENIKAKTFLNEEQREVVINSLISERREMREQLVDASDFKREQLNKRIGYINSTIEKFKLTSGLTYKIAAEELKRLEQKMYHTNPIRYFIAQTFNDGKHNTRGAEVIRNIHTNLNNLRQRISH